MKNYALNTYSPYIFGEGGNVYVIIHIVDIISLFTECYCRNITHEAWHNSFLKRTLLFKFFMKKLLCFLFVLFNLYNTNAQISDSICKLFRGEFPDARNMIWKFEGNHYIFTFSDLSDLRHKIVYSPEGVFEKCLHELGEIEIPVTISNYCVTNYPGEKFYNIWLDEDWQGNKHYYYSKKAEFVCFDREGNLLKKENFASVNE